MAQYICYYVDYASISENYEQGLWYLDAPEDVLKSFNSIIRTAMHSLKLNRDANIKVLIQAINNHYSFEQSLKTRGIIFKPFFNLNVFAAGNITLEELLRKAKCYTKFKDYVVDTRYKQGLSREYWESRLDLSTEERERILRLSDFKLRSLSKQKAERYFNNLALSYVPSVVNLYGRDFFKSFGIHVMK